MLYLIIYFGLNFSLALYCTIENKISKGTFLLSDNKITSFMALLIIITAGFPLMLYYRIFVYKK